MGADIRYIRVKVFHCLKHVSDNKRVSVHTDNKNRSTQIPTFRKKYSVSVFSFGSNNRWCNTDRRGWTDHPVMMSVMHDVWKMTIRQDTFYVGDQSRLTAIIN